jgi:hypothetical protein
VLEPSAPRLLVQTTATKILFQNRDLDC